MKFSRVWKTSRWSEEKKLDKTQKLKGNNKAYRKKYDLTKKSKSSVKEYRFQNV